MFVLDDVNCFVKEETRETRFGEVSLGPRDQDSIEKSDASHLREINWGRYALRGEKRVKGRIRDLRKFHDTNARERVHSEKRRPAPDQRVRYRQSLWVKLCVSICRPGASLSDK